MNEGSLKTRLCYTATNETVLDKQSRERVLHKSSFDQVGYFDLETNDFVFVATLERWKMRSPGETLDGYQVYWNEQGQRGCYDNGFFYPLDAFRIHIAGRFQRPAMTRSAASRHARLH